MGRLLTIAFRLSGRDEQSPSPTVLWGMVVVNKNHTTKDIVVMVHKPPPLRGAPFEKGAVPLTIPFRLSGRDAQCASPTVLWGMVVVNKNHTTKDIVVMVHKPPPLRGAPFEKGAVPLTRAFRLSGRDAP